MLPPPGALGLGAHPRASACCCCGIVITASTITTPSNASAATIAIIAMDVVVLSSRDELTILFLIKNKQRLNALLKIKSDKNCMTIYREAC
jgi:hypothetical protein